MSLTLKSFCIKAFNILVKSWIIPVQFKSNKLKNKLLESQGASELVRNFSNLCEIQGLNFNSRMQLFKI